MIFLIISLIGLVLYLYGVRTFGYWKKKGVKYDTPLPYFGNNLLTFCQKSSAAMTATEMYKKYPHEKVVGFFRSTAPELIIRDPELIKRILITDFQSFYARGLNTHKTVIEPLMKNLFFADGDLWRLIRRRFGQAFSTSRLKAMFHIITNTAQKLQIIAEDMSKLEHYDMTELMARYTTEFIGVCGFGLNMDSLSDERSEFRKLGKRIFHRTFRDVLATALKFMFPELCKNIHFFSQELEISMNYLIEVVLKERNYKPSGKNDFVDLMLEFKEKGKIVVESLEMKEADGSPKLVELELDDLLITAQIFVFFGAGFETSSISSSYTLHQLAYNMEYQKIAQEEIDRVLEKHGNKITYEAINDMPYVEKAFYESMRLYPSVGFLIRQCTAPTYTFPEIDLTIDKDVKVIIPIQALQRDEKYFEDANKFNPDRFSDANNIKSNVFLPFGDGPRKCVAARLGKMLAMAGIVAILQKFTVEPCAMSKRNPFPDPKGIVSENFIGGLPLKLKKRIRTP
ncbi:unnamed protein product, partial [Brenthis ino]